MTDTLIPKCVRSGFCCLKGPCAFGIWDHDKKMCGFLEVEKEPLIVTATPEEAFNVTEKSNDECPF